MTIYDQASTSSMLQMLVIYHELVFATVATVLAVAEVKLGALVAGLTQLFT